MIRGLSPGSLVLFLAAGCGSPEPAPARTGAALSVDYFGDTDVVGFHFAVERVACDAYDAFEPETIEANVDLVDGIFPAMIELVEQTLDPSSRHLGSDLFVTLPPGCWDVEATPVAEIDGDSFVPSADCSTASVEGVKIVAGQTTEVTLISQCAGDPNGAVDVLVLLNHPPEFDLTIDEKFNYECEPVNVCATISDPDDDPVEVVWESTSELPLFSITASDPVVVGFEDGHRVWEACAEIVTRYTGSYDLQVTVYDLGNDGGAQVRIEDLVAPEESHAELVFPIHTNWIEEPLCIDADGEAVPADGVDIVRAEGCAYTDAEEWYCSGLHPADPDVVQFVCDGTELLEDVLYPACPGVEICDEVDNDGDGAVDEGFVSGRSCSWSDDFVGGTNNNAGSFDWVSSTVDDAAMTWTFETELRHNGSHTDAFTIAINDGANPKGHGELALVYVDCTAAEAAAGAPVTPIVTVYAYNGLNTFTSYQDGNGDGVNGDADEIENSQANPALLVAGSCVDDGSALTVELTVDVSGINGHTPAFPNALVPWAGIHQGELFGIWMHPWKGGSFTYDGAGWITSASRAADGWFDAANLPGTCEDVCVAE